MSRRATPGARVTEQTLKRGLMAEIKRHLPTAVAIRHEDRYTHGIPDLSLSLAGRTTWWEVKYADPSVRTKGIQHHLCARLAAETYCRYIVYQRGIPSGRTYRPRQIRVVPPADIDCWQRAGRVLVTGSFEQYAVVVHLARVHGVTL